MKQRRQPRGYAMMLALILTAAVLGGSALALQRTVSERRAMKLQQETVQLESALRSGERLAQSLVAAARVGPQDVTLSDVNLQLRFTERSALPARYDVDISARKGSGARRTMACYQRVLTLPACVGCDGAGLGPQDVVEQVRVLAASPDACVHRVEGAEPVSLPPPECAQAPVVVLDVTGDVVTVVPGTRTVQGPQMVHVRGARTVRVAGVHDLTDTLLATTGDLELEPGAQLKVDGAVLVNGQVRGAVEAVSDEKAVRALLSPPVPGCTDVVTASPG
ncbi:MAG: hypothetical protein AB2A00_22195 [Myxococcota bacterium]